MGKGGLNRLLLTGTDQVHESPQSTSYVLPGEDSRANHIRTILARASPLNLRIAVEGRFLHDEAIANVQDDGTVVITVPSHGRRCTPPPPAVGLIVAMQRPKVIARVLEAAAALGVSVICVVAADKVEKSYWDCKLFRDADDEVVLNGNAHVRTNPLFESTPCETDLPGRPRGAHNHPHRNSTELSISSPRRVDHLHAVRRRLNEAVQQASTDAAVPVVMLERRGLHAVLEKSHAFWQSVRTNASRVVAHPYAVGKSRAGAITRIVASGLHGAVLAIGPEGGWTDPEVSWLADNDFFVAGLGERVLRSETAVVVGLGLVHEGLRLRDLNTPSSAGPSVAANCDNA